MRLRKNTVHRSLEATRKVKEHKSAFERTSNSTSIPMPLWVHRCQSTPGIQREGSLLPQWQRETKGRRWHPVFRRKELQTAEHDCRTRVWEGSPYIDCVTRSILRIGTLANFAQNLPKWEGETFFKTREWMVFGYFGRLWTLSGSKLSNISSSDARDLL